MSRMKEMLDLFEGRPAYPNAPGFKDPTTSLDAARAIEPIAGSLRAAILAAYREERPRGLTADEVACRLGRSILSVRPRVTELYWQGLLERTGERRRNTSGMDAHVMRAKERER